MIKALIFDFDGLILDTETPDFESWRQYSHAITTLLASFIVGTGVCAQEEFSQLQRQMDFEALADDFCEIRYFLTLWGQKPQ